MNTKKKAIFIVIGLFTGVFWPTSGVVATIKKSSPSRIAAPETEIAQISTHLEQLAIRIKSLPSINASPGVSAENSIDATNSFENGLLFFRQKNYLSAIRELNDYLQVTQVPVLPKYLQAHYFLARSNQAIGRDHDAVRSYMLYVSAFLTAPERDFVQFQDVLQRLVPLAAKDSLIARAELNQLLSAIATLDVPSEQRPVVTYLISKSAFDTGQTRYAAGWLDSSAADVQGPDQSLLRSQMFFLRGMVALKEKNYTAAEKLFLEVLLIETPENREIKNLSRLALARICMATKKPQSALTYYSGVDENAPQYKDALFESIHVHLDYGEDDAARAKAKLFVARFPDAGYESWKIRTLLAYLDMRAGDLKSAQLGIMHSDQNLLKLSNWLNKNFGAKERITQTELSDLYFAAGPATQNSPLVQEGYRQFVALGDISRRLADLRGDLRNMIYSVGRLDAASLVPEWQNRAKQLDAVGQEILEAGHRLAATERHFYSSVLSPAQTQALNASENRRTLLLSQAAKMHRAREEWPVIADFLKITYEIAQNTDKLNMAEADLAAIRFSAKTSGKDSNTDLAKIQKRITKTRQALARTLETLRKKRVSTMIVDSPHRRLQKFVSQYASNLHEESVILHSKHDGASSIHDRMFVSDAENAWNRWEFLIEETYKQIAALEGQMQANLGIMVEKFDEFETSYRHLSNKKRDMTDKLERLMGRSIAPVLAHYNSSISELHAKNQKWAADIDWLSFNQASSKKDSTREKFNLEKQILDDNLLDLEQGVLWQWPQ